MSEWTPPQVDGEAAREHAVLEDAILEDKARALRDALASCESLLIAFSGGADSAYLAWEATSVLGPSALCVTADSPSYPDHHRQLALRIAREFGLHHEIIHTAELERPEYRANPTNRCYYCKHELYTALTRIGTARGFAVIADGSNADDRGDYRPGRQAAREFGVRSPLDEVGLTKPEIRELSRRAGLPTWDEPASACLSSRIPYHSEVTAEKLHIIERAEAAVRAMGFRVCRVAASRSRCRRRPHDGTGPARDRPRRAAARPRGRDQRASGARVARHRLSARDHRSPGVPDGQPQRRCSPPCRLRAREFPTLFWQSPRSIWRPTSRFSHRRSRTSTRSTLHSGCGTMTWRSISRTRRATRSTSPWGGRQRRCCTSSRRRWDPRASSLWRWRSGHRLPVQWR